LTVVELARDHVCPKCGDRFSLSARNSRLHRERGTQPLCEEGRNPPKAPDEATRARMVRWWLKESGLSLDELLEIGRLLG
jgi:hypothetical protein